MAQEAGEGNFFLFGLTAEQVANSRGWYSPWWHYNNEPETRAALDLMFSDVTVSLVFSPRSARRC
jgi:starch phosphorylase